MKRSLHIRLFLRSFFLQTGWNYTKYQNFGFTFVMLPFLRRLYRYDQEALPTVLQRYLDNFNTHPIMASFCFGALAKQEERIASAKAVTDYKEQILEWQGIRRGLSITAASIGDRLFWGTLKPLTLLLAIFIWMVLGIDLLNMDLKSMYYPLLYIFAGSAVAFLVYNSIALFVRWKGINMGYRNEESSCFGLTHFDWNRTIYQAKRMGMLFAAALILLGVYRHFHDASLTDFHSIAQAILVLFFVIFSFFTRRMRIPNVYLYIASVIVFNLVCLL